MIRALNRVASTVLAVLVVVAPPTVAAVWLAHRPWHRLDSADVRAWVADPPDTAAIWLLVAAGAIALWLLTTTLILRAAAHTAARVWRRLRRLPLPTPAQATAGSLAGTALLGLPAVAVTPAHTVPAPAATSSNQQHDPALPPTDGQHTDQPTGVTLTDGSWLPAHTAEQ